MTDFTNDPNGVDGDNANMTRSTNDRRRQRQRVPIPTVDEILQQLLQLNGAVAIGAMATKDANLIQKNLRTVLDVQMKRANREDSGPSQEALAELCRDDPRALNAIEPFLTDTQLAELVNEVTDDPDGPV